MLKNPKITLAIPGENQSGSYFSFRLKRNLDNEPCVFRRPEKIFVISDIEGNFKTFCKLLYNGKVINKKLQWIFSDNHLVILGDCFDRGEQVAECLWLIYSLEEKAREVGGYVHFILGNHEIMNMNGDWRYVHPKYAALNGAVSTTALYDGNTELWRWLRTKNIMEKIGNTLFVHGGISEDLLVFNVSINDINKRVRPYYLRANEQFEDPLLNTVFGSMQSPFWFRGYYQPGMDESLIDAVLKKYKVSRIITGHTVVDEISPFFNGKLINIDTNHTTENSEALLIVRRRFYRIKVDNTKEMIAI